MDDALAVLVIFVYIKIDDITYVDELFVSFKVSARFAHDDSLSVINKVESSYTFDNSSCHTRSVPLAVVFFIIDIILILILIFIFVFVFIFIVVVISCVRRFFRIRLRS